MLRVIVLMSFYVCNFLYVSIKKKRYIIGWIKLRVDIFILKALKLKRAAKKKCIGELI